MKKNYTQTQKDITPREAILLLMQYCSREERCSYDATKKLQTFSLPDTEIETIVDTLIKEKFIDDLRYATAYANDKYRFNKWGKFKISFALKQKKISENIIDQAIEIIPDEKYSSILNEELSKKLRTFPNTLSDYEKRGKLFRFAAGRGFETDDISEAINNLLKEK